MVGTEDCITLITRPRRLGKTLNMSMFDCFFSNKYANHSDLFEVEEAMPILGKYRLEQDEDSIWSLLMASGYLKIESVEYRGLLMEPYYHLTIMNLETVVMFSNLFRGWFAHSDANYNCFVKALLRGSLEEMNIYMNDVALVTFSNFDTGKRPSSQSQPERFCHGVVLGFLVGLREEYEVKSNRESGYGRYDVMLIPTDIHNEKTPAIVLEFKVHRPDKESSLQETVQMALNQIEEKNYDAELLAIGIPKASIRHYGFAFEGKIKNQMINELKI